jgi:acyl-CoA synthetase (AMP-forming)/AMP-acid ligase II
VLGETAARTNEGAGVCVGRKFDSIEWRVIRIADAPIATIDDAEEVPVGEIGELIVRGPQVSPAYVTRITLNAAAKIIDKRAGPSSAPHGGEDAPAHPEIEQGALTWHRTGDVGYLDDHGRFWYCGRKSQRVETAHGTLFTELVEAIFNAHPFVSRTALVGVGTREQQLAVIVFEPRYVRANPPYAYGNLPIELRERALKHELTKEIAIFLRRWRLPVDIRHNAKINREWLADWATRKVSRLRSGPEPPASSP